jgi:hypothetical protein
LQGIKDESASRNKRAKKPYDEDDVITSDESEGEM